MSGECSKMKQIDNCERWLDQDQNAEVQTCVRALTAVMVEDMATWMKEDTEKD
jgi:hypothetical protein